MPQQAFTGFVLQFDGSTVTPSAATPGATYTVGANDSLVTVTTVALGPSTTVSLPALSASLIGRVITVVDIGGNAGTSTVQVSAAGGNNINGSGSFNLNQNYESVTLYAATSTRWVILNNQA